MEIARLMNARLFVADPVAMLMSSMIILVVTVISSFSRRYLAGDRKQSDFRRTVWFLGASLVLMVFSNHLAIFYGSWVTSNLLLVRLMIHKSEWVAARNSGILAMKSLGLGMLFLAGGFLLLSSAANSVYINEINLNHQIESFEITLGLLLIILAAMVQSASWPFHRWLISSLNSPTPVSALMHAGLVNGGGFLLVRFAPLFLLNPALLQFIFVMGLISAIVGSFWKLLQPDVKRMLACSTMGQLGFMLMQCGMGLFAPAFSHLCWHGLFKAFLFLSTGSVVQERREKPIGFRPSFTNIIAIVISGMAGAWAFGNITAISASPFQTGLIMVALSFLVSAQVGLQISTRLSSLITIFLAPLAGLLTGTLYGTNLYLVEILLTSQHLDQTQPMNGIYLTGLILLALIWLVTNTRLLAGIQANDAWKKLYMKALNASQPAPQTITAVRSLYQN